MLPLAHIGLSLATFGFLRKKGFFKGLDYKKVALAAILPDLIDKPLAIFVFPESKSALLFSHTLLLHLAVWVGIALKNWRNLPYALAFSGHLILDRIWEFPQTFFFPFRGWSFHRWRDVGSPEAFGKAYFEVMMEHPELLVGEVVGIIALLWFFREKIKGKL
ncbi:MAG: hypothetical protein RMK30_02730 [Anaerolineae bacterium]|nr:hypothetical protein [Anaerolineae bacterium]MDW8101769.1 hypothetical protein [Anaerolineae bacterium]